MTRHPASVCAAARRAFQTVLSAAPAPSYFDAEGGAMAGALGAIRFEAREGLRANAQDIFAYTEALARILGASAVPAVLRVRARRAASR